MFVRTILALSFTLRKNQSDLLNDQERSFSLHHPNNNHNHKLKKKRRGEHVVDMVLLLLYTAFLSFIFQKQ